MINKTSENQNAKNFLYCKFYDIMTKWQYSMRPESRSQ